MPSACAHAWYCFRSPAAQAAFLSTTFDREVALAYARAPGRPGIVFEMQLGMVDRGAELGWISQYPHERECCFPPLTGLEVQRTRVDGAVLVIEARVSANLNSLTIEQVVAKRQHILLDMARGMRFEVASELLRTPLWAEHPQQVALRADWAELQVMRNIVRQHEPQWFNDDKNFSDAIDRALQIRKHVGCNGPPPKASVEEVRMDELPWASTDLACAAPSWVKPSYKATSYLRILHAQGKLKAMEAEYAGLRREQSDLRVLAVQASGHAEQLYTLEDGAILLKETNVRERDVYVAIQGTPLAPFAPPFYEAHPQDSHMLLFIKNVTAGMLQPHVMDAKIGTRGFKEEEADNPKLRRDLTEKASKIDALRVHLTDQELEHGMSKLRYMQLRDSESSTTSLGFRIEGVSGQSKEMKKPSKTMKEEAAVRETIRSFAQGRPEVLKQMIARMVSLREALQEGPGAEWFRRHELISSSLLFVYDAAEPPGAQASVWMLDFANVTERNVDITHRAPFVFGNHEDGYLFGLDSLIRLFGLEAGDVDGV
jgi:hypothetical protein